MFRWWARRPHALIGALVDASNLAPGELVSDPFGGGGTTALEAARRGFNVYSQDVHPWAVWGLGTALDGTSAEKLESTVARFLDELEPLRKQAYRVRCPAHGPSETLHVFWVRRCACPSCGSDSFLLPYSLITVASRRRNEAFGFYGCRRCGTATRHRLGGSSLRCTRCKAALADERTALLGERRVSCPQCRADIPYDRAWGAPIAWGMLLIQRRCTHRGAEVVHFDTPRRADIRAAEKFGRMKAPPSLLARIPVGDETGVLRRTGFQRWRDLYPRRQLHTLLRAARKASHLDCDRSLRNRIQLALVGCAEMAGHLCRWDRFHPKSFEALANHRFSALGVAVETNLLATRGRGTLRRRLLASLNAARWCERENIVPARISSVAGPPIRHDDSRIRVIVGSSSRQLLPRASVSLVLTDPPYYDAVQYGELAELFLAWARAVRPSVGRWRLERRAEAVPNSARGRGPKHYERLLRSIFCETARTLKPRATVILTYHSSSFRGWAALGAALYAAGLHVVGLAVAKSENGNDHSKRGRRSFTEDLILECQNARRRASESPRVITPVREPRGLELVAAGRAIAAYGGGGFLEMAESFHRRTRSLRRRRIEINKVDLSS